MANISTRLIFVAAMLGSPVANADRVHEPFSPVQVCNDGNGDRVIALAS
jgi:hypothetical protein